MVYFERHEVPFIIAAQFRAGVKAKVSSARWI
jgi:hypothetical protein